MKILHIITSLGTGGAEKLIIETIPLYNSKGIEADVLVLHGNDTPFYNHKHSHPQHRKELRLSPFFCYEQCEIGHFCLNTQQFLY